MEKLKRALSLSVLAAGFSYGVLWLAHAQFYLRLGTTPEEAGVDKIDLLSQALVGPAVLFVTLLLIAVVMLSVFILIGLINLWVLRSTPRPRSGLPGDDKRRRSSTPVHDARVLVHAWASSKLRQLGRVAGWTTALVAPLIFLLVGAMLYWQAIASAHDARRGIAVDRPILPMGWGVEIPLLDVRALPVTIGGNGRETSLSRAIGQRGASGCLLYLGEADGTSLLYDPDAHDLIRLPSNDVVLVLDVSPEEQAQSSCPPPS